METPESSGWVSVRCLFRWMRQEEQLYEERVTLWRTGDLDDAIARAEVEASAYAAGSPVALSKPAPVPRLTKPGF